MLINRSQKIKFTGLGFSYGFGLALCLVALVKYIPSADLHIGDQSNGKVFFSSNGHLYSLEDETPPYMVTVTSCGTCTTSDLRDSTCGVVRLPIDAEK